MKQLFFIPMLFVLLLACNNKSEDNPTPAPVPTPIPPVVVPDDFFTATYQFDDLRKDTTLFASAKLVGNIRDNALIEASGLGASQVNKGLLWTEEDSGNPSNVQLINPKATCWLHLPSPALPTAIGKTSP